MKRVFAGIPASEEIKNKIAEWAESHRDWPLRFVSGNGLHITLVQPWYAGESEISDYKSKVAETFKDVRPFRIKFKKITFGTSPERPRLIWTMGESSDREAMLRLKSAAETAFGQKEDVRLYVPHLTLARFKEVEFAGFPDQELDEEIDWEMTVDSVALYESRLLQSGSKYEILQKIELSPG